jgi:hypothetical protein
MYRENDSQRQRIDPPVGFITGRIATGMSDP